MEGLTVVSTMDKVLATLGISGTLIVMGVIAFFVIREVKKANENTQKAVDSLKTSTEQKLDALKAHSDAKDKEIVSRLEQAEKDLKFLEKDAVTKEMLYRETEGWRSEIQLVRAEISKLPFEILKLTEGKK
jgi:CO dehydrogenase/acetyl-CoA synthase alpha subunit